MATSPIFSSSSNFPFLLLFLGLLPVAFAIFPPSSVASTQLDFWSKNVLNSMPESVLSKLSPLSKQDSDYFASLVSKQPLSSDPKFCSTANLACTTSQSDRLVPAAFGAYGYGSIATGHASDKADPNSYFRLSILKKGTKVQLPNLDQQFPPRAFLPYQIASKISTTSSTDLQKLFPESFASSAGKDAIKESIFYCSLSNLEGEIRSCPNSLESMIEFSKKASGEKKLIAVTSKITKGSQKLLEIGNIEQFHAEKVVSCHEIFYPFATYLCHLLSSSHLYAVDFVEPTTKAPVNRIVAICHMDTSEWSAEHVSFKVLKSSPGQGEVCHWFSKIDLAWIGNGEKKF